ncbi:MAG: hypothetical protein AAGE84_21470 [Cyanobacteria bacterium P01_G01_bin.39]
MSEENKFPFTPYPLTIGDKLRKNVGSKALHIALFVLDKSKYGLKEVCRSDRVVKFKLMKISQNLLPTTHYLLPKSDLQTT